MLLSARALAGIVLVDMLDVGQGDAILVRGGGKSVLIDAGDRGCPVVQQLRTLGVTRLDLVVATHPHADHIGEMPDVLRAFEVGLYIDNGLPHTTEVYAEVNATLDQKKVPRKVAVSGTTIALGREAMFTVLFPAGRPLRDTRSDLNSNSVVLRIDHGDDVFIFTGDAEQPTEDALLRTELGDVDVLKVPHHGSAHSSTPAFLRRVSPEVALISAGAGNRYHHPAAETVDRLRNAGAIVYRTDTSGHLRVISDGHEVEVLEGALAEILTIEPVQR
jgi:competence protein ComEC